MTPAGWSPVDQALMHAARVPAVQERVVEAASRLGVRARQRYGDALKPLKRTHPQRAAWSVAQVAAVNAREWRDRGYPSGGDGGGRAGSETWCFTHQRAAGRCSDGAACEVESMAPSGDRLSDIALAHDEASTVFHRANQAAWRVMRAVELTKWPAVFNALADLLAIMDEAAGLAPMPAPTDLNTPETSCAVHAKAGMWAAPSHTRQGVNVCDYCYRAHRTTGQWPDKAWLEAASRNDQRTVRRCRTAAMELTEEEAKMQRTGRWFGAADLALGVRANWAPVGRLVPEQAGEETSPHDLTPPTILNMMEMSD